MIENVIFDFGQVLVHFEPEYMVRQYVTDDEDVKLLSEVIFETGLTSVLSPTRKLLRFAAKDFQSVFGRMRRKSTGIGYTIFLKSTV